MPNKESYSARFERRDPYSLSEQARNTLKLLAPGNAKPIPSLIDVDVAFTEVYGNILVANPTISPYELYEKAANVFPGHVREDVHTTVWNGLQSANEDERRLATSVGVSLNLHTILAATKPFKSGNVDADDVLIQEVIAQTATRLPTLLQPSRVLRTTRLYQGVKSVAAKHVAEIEEDLQHQRRTLVVADPSAVHEELDQLEDAIRERFGNDAERIIQFLHERFGIDRERGVTLKEMGAARSVTEQVMQYRKAKLLAAIRAKLQIKEMKYNKQRRGVRRTKTLGEPIASEVNTTENIPSTSDIPPQNALFTLWFDVNDPSERKAITAIVTFMHETLEKYGKPPKTNSVGV